MKKLNPLIITFFLSLVLFACQDQSKPQETPDTPASGESEPIENNAFQTVIETFPGLDLPYHKIVNVANWSDDLGPDLMDSTFVIHHLDAHFFEDEERTYGYHRGFRLPSTGQYEALIIPFGWNAGTDFLLRTYRPDGTLIDTFMFATLQSDLYRMESRIDEKGIIRRAKMAQLYDDRSGESYDAYPHVSYYQIKENGQIEQVEPPYGTADDWVGRWQLASPFPGVQGYFIAEPQTIEQFRFDVSLTVEPSMRTRDLSSEALVDRNTAHAKDKNCPLKFELQGDKVVIEGECQDDPMANFSGIYLKYPAYQEKYLEEDPDQSFASCTAYRVINDQYQPMEVPEAVKKWLECPSLLELSFDWNYLISHDGEGLKAYDFKTGNILPIVDLEKKTEGLSGFVWSPNGQKVAFVEVNQDEFLNKTRLHILDFSQGQPKYDRHLDLKINFSCASICAASPWGDYSWKDDQTIKYSTYEAYPYDTEGMEKEVKI